MARPIDHWVEHGNNRFVTAVCLSNLAYTDSAFHQRLDRSDGVVTELIGCLVVEVGVDDTITSAVGLKALGVVDTIMDDGAVVAVYVDDGSLGLAYTEMIDLCTIVKRVANSDLVLAGVQIVVIVRSVSPIIATVGVSSVEYLDLRSTGSGIHGDLEVNVLKPADILRVTNGQRIVASRWHSDGKFDPGMFFSILPVTVMRQVIPASVTRRRSLVDVVTRIGIGWVCHRRSVGIVAKVGRASTPTIATWNGLHIVSLEALQRSGTVSVGVTISFTETIVARAIGVHQIITDILQTRNIDTCWRHEEILGLINVRIGTILLRLGRVEVNGTVDTVHHVATIVAVEGILPPAAVGIAWMVGPANLGAVSHFRVGTGSPVLPVARHGRLGRVHLVLDVGGTAKSRIGRPIGNIEDVEIGGGDTKGVLVQESRHLIPLTDATAIRSQDEARIGTRSWKSNGALGRDVGADERSRRSKDGSGLSSSGRLPLPAIVGPSDGDDLSVFSRRGICLNLGESTESISGGQSHFESTPLGEVDVGGSIEVNVAAVHRKNGRRGRL